MDSSSSVGIHFQAVKPVCALCSRLISRRTKKISLISCLDLIQEIFLIDLKDLSIQVSENLCSKCYNFIKVSFKNHPTSVKIEEYINWIQILHNKFILPIIGNEINCSNSV